MSLLQYVSRMPKFALLIVAGSIATAPASRVSLNALSDLDVETYEFEEQKHSITGQKAHSAVCNAQDVADQAKQAPCEVLAKFADRWDSNDPTQIQGCMEGLTTGRATVDLALTKSGYVKIYRQNVGKRLNEYKDYFSWEFQPNWQIKEVSGSKVVAERVGSMVVSIPFFYRTSIALLMQRGNFAESTAVSLQNGNHKKAKLITELTHNGSGWLIDKIIVLKQE